MKIHVHEDKLFLPEKPMDREEYIMIKISMIPQEFVEKYNLREKCIISTSWNG